MKIYGEEPGIIQLNFEVKSAYDRYIVSSDGRIFVVEANRNTGESTLK